MMAGAGTGGEGPLTGRRGLVTGGATGIGRATAKRLAADGAAVTVNYIGSQEPADEVVEEISEAGGRGTAIEADVSDEGAVARLFRRSAEELEGPVDLLVNNAGIESPFPLAELPLEEWERVLAVNLTGPFLCSREMARSLPSGEGGVIVNVSSVHELIPRPNFAHYCASKGGLKLFGQTIARELAPRGIRVASVAPGAILTSINRELIDNPDRRREKEEQIPWGRPGQPEEVAAAIAWLAGPEAEYVTGSTLFVDGGMTLYPKFV
jgi:glucose 1-dehydrogenase